MSWLLKRWLLPPEEKPSSQSPTPTIDNNNNTTTQQLQQTNTTATTAPAPPKEPPLIPNNAKLLISGLLFFSLSALITRRALSRKHLSTVPPFYTSSPFHKPSISGGQDAFEALNIATINTVSIAMIAAGATFCVMDIDSVETARKRYREKMGLEGSLKKGVMPSKEEEEQFERDMEEWLGTVFEKKDLGEVRRRVEEARQRDREKAKEREQQQQ
uniref:Altered inheritance of mitochondria protein 11 n=1 Tax=Talaromyces marneffei PM1 TaxID=1077442 RepID=A0A093VBY5_TALMA